MPAIMFGLLPFVAPAMVGLEGFVAGPPDVKPSLFRKLEEVVGRRQLECTAQTQGRRRQTPARK